MKTIELPEPWRIDADGEEHYTADQMRDHAEAVRLATIAECAQVAHKFVALRNNVWKAA